SEQLHWPEVDFSKKSIFSSADRVVSPSQVCLQKISSSVLRGFRDAGSSSYNVLLRAEEEKKKRKKRSACRRPQTSGRGGSSSGRRNRLSPAQKKNRVPDGAEKPVQTHWVSSDLPTPTLMVTGSKLGLSLRTVPQLRKTCIHDGHRPAPPPPHRAPMPREAENGRRFCILSAIKPSNVDKEKEKFFKSGFSYDPQFEYSSPPSAAVLARHNNASDRFLTQAVNIMEAALQRYGSYEKFEQQTGGNLLSKARIWSSVKRYMEKEGCVGEIVVMVTEDLLSRASMTVVNGRPTMSINSSSAREHWLEGMLRHEIGTHYFRSINNLQQVWSSGGGRKRLSLKPVNPTEEGLASIHSVLFRKDPTLWRAALLYYTVYQASRMSFSQLFHKLGHFVQDPITRWDYCVRAKRGQSDTARPGCFSKDQVYLEGILKILRYRDKIDFPLLMALGKVSFEDVDRLKALAHMENVRIPHFMQDQARYAEQLTKIMEVNRLTDEELKSLI
ncbi:PREDICTED: uncharacterized protein KIAA0895 homolog, partial [Cyprinodon variegatus]|uniref:uncharacterized protein KIAA0895 homolog n=1 Tax=Cyprinodon variegatus TaxID=28743 RepID=UPI0007426CD8